MESLKINDAIEYHGLRRVYRVEELLGSTERVIVIGHADWCKWQQGQLALVTDKGFVILFTGYNWCERDECTWLVMSAGDEELPRNIVMTERRRSDVVGKKVPIEDSFSLSGMDELRRANLIDLAWRGCAITSVDAIYYTPHNIYQDQLLMLLLTLPEEHVMPFVNEIRKRYDRLRYISDNGVVVAGFVENAPNIPVGATGAKFFSEE